MTEFQEWKQLESTQQFFRGLQAQYEQLKENWAHQVYREDYENAFSLGSAFSLREIINLEGFPNE